MKLLIVTPHLSTGGLPQYLVAKMRRLEHELVLVEYQFHGPEYVVHRNQALDLLATTHGKFYSLGDNKADELLAIIKKEKPNWIHLEEIPELFMDRALADKLYSLGCPITETTHASEFDPDKKEFLPEAFYFVSRYSQKQYAKLGVPSSVIEYELEPLPRPDRTAALQSLGLDPNQQHVLNVGLWTPGKNQSELVEIARQLPQVMFHCVGNQAPNFRTYWEPVCADLPPNVKVHGERADVRQFYRACDLFLFTSLRELNPLVVKEALAYGMPVIMRNLPTYLGAYDKREKVTFLTEDFEANVTLVGKALGVTPLPYAAPERLEPVLHFVNTAYVELPHGRWRNCHVVMRDADTGEQLYETTLASGGHWTKAYRSYYTRWHINIKMRGHEVFDYTLNLKGQRVFILIDSYALGDTLAWIPYVEEFRQKHQAHVICATHWNGLFDYPEIEFVKPGQEVPNVLAQYTLNCFPTLDRNQSPYPWNEQPLQAVAAGLLGLPYKEIRPRLVAPPSPRMIQPRYVAIATESTSPGKFWQRPGGWEAVVRWLASQGLAVINVSLNAPALPLTGLLPPGPIENVVRVLQHCEFFIGLPSGLSWLAWAVGKPVVMISGFSPAYVEFQSNRIHVGPSADKCQGCYSVHEKGFDTPAVDCCPRMRNTSRRFECTTSITPDQVIAALQPLCHKEQAVQVEAE